MSTEREYLEGQIVLVGHGHVGRRIAETLAASSIPDVVAEQNRQLVEALRKKGIAAVSGDAAEPAVLIQAHIADAAMLVVTTPDSLAIRQMIATARALNPQIEIVLLGGSEDESALLCKEAAGTVFVGDEELAKGMASHVVDRFLPKHATAGH